MIQAYFQIIDQPLRRFIDKTILRLPVDASMGETPPAITDAVIFYDPLVVPTRPGHILPNELIQAIKNEDRQAAETILIKVVAEGFENSCIDIAHELARMEERKKRMREEWAVMDKRHPLLEELRVTFEKSVRDLKDRLEQVYSGDVTEISPADEPAAVGREEPAADDVQKETKKGDLEHTKQALAKYYEMVGSRVRAIIEENQGGLSREMFDPGDMSYMDLGIKESISGKDGDRLKDMLNRPSDGRVLFTTEFLALKFSDIFKLRRIEEVREELESLREKIGDVKSRLEQLQAKRIQVLNSVGLNLNDHFQSITNEIAELKTRIEKMSFQVDSDISTRTMANPEVREMLQKMDLAIVQTMRELSELVTEREHEKPVSSISWIIILNTALFFSHILQV